MSPDQMKKAKRESLIKLYKVICFCGTGLMIWMDKAALLSKLQLNDRYAAHICTLYFTFALVCMLLGMIASSFPDSAPFALFVSWNGALHAFLFGNASFHLSIMQFYTKMEHMYGSFFITSALFSIVWYFGTHVHEKSSTEKKKGC
ncbi:hypothetical protein EJB05_28779 [Eragrostis curvula]|uniref:Uncharacterized protein n=1 Tax=Eragrostis curvula TaxID=38414 RepID=A0A5J9UR20_9POAL|nr:hypothetical protein EJB05_28779 [Eragrostis curvula]